MLHEMLHEMPHEPSLVEMNTLEKAPEIFYEETSLYEMLPGTMYEGTDLVICLGETK